MPTGERGAAFAGCAWIIDSVVSDSQSTWLYGALCAVISAVILGVSRGRGGLQPRAGRDGAPLFAFVPFTEQYVREWVPEAFAVPQRYPPGAGRAANQT